MIALLPLLVPAFAEGPATPAAATSCEAPLIPGVCPLYAPPAADQVDPTTRALGRKLRCPVCQGSNITDSPSETAKAMFERSRQLVAAGYSEQQIIDYFVDKYTEFVLLDPQRDGMNMMLFVGPGLGVGLGLALALRAIVGWRREPGTGPVRRPSPEETEELDDYERRLLAELNADDV